jgi:D-lyxose ketol-isomerase
VRVYSGFLAGQASEGMPLKRSEINRLVGEAGDFFAALGFVLPPFSRWSAARWRQIGRDADGIRRAGLGWDITDFGSGEFCRKGLTLFTIRNGVPGEPGSKTYCEKLMMVRPEQVTPLHFHFAKTEDIINRGGGRLALRFFWATPDEGLDKSKPVAISIDGMVRTVAPGEQVILTPGESVTIPQRLYHDFWAIAGGDPVMAGEVSSVNDDRADNRFLEAPGRFPRIEEDEPPAFLLCSEYPG